jgi:CP family cyanate transporter-like MFS transporter
MDSSPTRAQQWMGLSMSWLAAVNCRAPFVATGALLPLVIASLHLSQVTASWLTALPLVVLALLSIPGGLLGDRVGPYAVLLGTQLLIAVGGALRGLATGPDVFLLGVGILGAGIGLAQPALAQAAKLLATGRETVATTIYSNGLVLGGLAGTALSAPVLLPLAGGRWQDVFYLWGVLGGAAACGWAVLMWLRPLPRPPRPQVRSVRVRGSWSMPGFAPLSIVFCAETAIFYALVTWLPDYYVAHGSTVALAAIPVSALSAGSVAGGLLSPLLARWFGGFRGALLATGVVDLAAQLGFLALPDLGWLWAAAAGAATAVALTLGMAAPAVLTSPDRTGRVSGLLLALGYGFGTLGPLGIGFLRQNLGTFTAGFWFLVGLAALWSLAAAFLPRLDATGT